MPGPFDVSTNSSFVSFLAAKSGEVEGVPKGSVVPPVACVLITVPVPAD